MQLFRSPAPNIFALPPGADFPALLVRGLQDRLAAHPPEAMARVQLFVNTERMKRRIVTLFTAKGAALLPKIRLITDLSSEAAIAGIPPAIPPLRRRLELTQLVSRLLDAEPDLAPRAALFDLADSLATLMDEMQGEGVPPEVIANLDVSNHSAHWTRTQNFMRIIAPFFTGTSDLDPEARQRRVVGAMIENWRANPAADPIIVAGSTASRGTTALFMRAVAALPQGALILPGFDFDLPEHVWANMDDALTSEDHPQYRFHKLLSSLGKPASAVEKWVETEGPDPARNRLVSLSLRPAPVTDQWLIEGKTLGDLTQATKNVTLIEATTPRAEALAIALVMRKAAEEGKTVALITPDRGLTRRVTAALDQWRIVPDDSAGRPLALSAPGRLLRHVAALFGQRLTSQSLLTILKHPLTASGADRGTHLRLTRDLELKLRKYGPPFPNPAMLAQWAAAKNDDAAPTWAAWISDIFAGIETISDASLADHFAKHLQMTEELARGPTGRGTGELWLQKPGEEAAKTIASLASEVESGGSLSPYDYRDLFDALLNKGSVRDEITAHPNLMIWGTLEARVQGAELVILGGLNDGSWPQMPSPDPWLNRKMRQDAALLLPERQIGLAAHDYQQAIGAPEVILTRAERDAEAECIPSRWLNRLQNLLGGLPEQNGPEALAAMRARGKVWLTLANAFETPAQSHPLASRPSPRPPLAVRPKELPVTGISTLIRDPYAIYARYILRLRKLDPLKRDPDARLRGSLLHKILERFVRERPVETLPEARLRLLKIANEVMESDAPWPAARALWLARMERAADFFLATDSADDGAPMVIESKGAVALTGLPFTLTAKPDRIDALPDGRLHLLDYKTGTPPTPAQQKKFDKQLLLEAAMAERGGFVNIGPREVAKISYIGLGSSPKVEETAITETLLSEVWEDLHKLIARYFSPVQGYPSRRAVFEDRFPGDYDHLARYGEWEMTDLPMPQDIE